MTIKPFSQRITNLLEIGALERAMKGEIDDLRARVAELETFLDKANMQTEEFERKFYLESDKVEALQTKLAAGAKP